MGGSNLRLRVSDRSTIAICLAVLLASATLVPLTKDTSYLVLSSVLVLALSVICVALRRLRTAEPVVLGIQLLVVLAYSFAVSMGLGGGAGNPLAGYGQLFGEAITHMRTQAPPMDPNPGVKLLFVVAIGVIYVLTDVMVNGIDRAMWSFAPLAALFLVPALGITTDDVPWWTFVLIAVGYLLILLAEGVNTTERWPRGVRKSSHDRGSAPLAWRLGAMIGIPAIVLTLGLGMIIPVHTSNGWGISRSRGNQGPLQMADPTLDLRRNLNQPMDRVVMTYRTDQPAGAYLRMASLPVFDANGWQNTAMQLSPGENLPPAPGYREQPGQKVRNTEIQVTDFRAEYLPLPYAPDSFSAAGEWAFDRDSLVVLSTAPNRGEAIQNLSYSVRSTEIEPDGPGLSTASAGTPPDAQLTVPLPQDLPNDIINLALRVTNDAPTPALKAAAIQQYLRSDGGYVYSTEPQPGSSYQSLENFLFEDKKGYCEQFAGSMAIMARIAGIPSRVAVGFLPGERRGDAYEVSVRDMHAWPELWFEGYGWVRFEPTPSIAQAPAWTITAAEGESNESASANPTPTESIAPPPPASPTTAPSAPPAPVQETAFPWARVGLAALVVAVLAGLACTPMLLRNRRRTQRLGVEHDPDRQVENAWAEVRDSVIDYGGAWPAGSPRVIGTQVAHDLADPGAKEAMTGLSLMVERARYARTHSVEQDLSEVTEEVRKGLAEQSTGGGRLAATWWPRSLWVNLGERIMGGPQR